MLEEGLWTVPDGGTPQGGNLSPLLANVFLHYVLDLWWERKIKPTAGGTCVLVRYADDFVCLVQHRRSQRRDFTWKRLNDHLKRYPLPRPRIVYRLYPLLPLWESDRRAGCGRSARPVL